MIIFFVLIFFSGYLGNNQHEKNLSFIGKKIVVEKDTLQIIDYNGLFMSYTLSNGVNIDKTFVQKNAIK